MARDSGPLSLSPRPANPVAAFSLWLARGLPHLRRFFVSKPLGATGGVVIFLVIFAAIFAPVIVPFDPFEFNLTETGLPIRLEAPNTTFLFGTDTLGRDVFSRIIYGARVSLIVGIGAVALGVTFGTLIGLISGYFSGKIDQLLQRTVDTFMAIPAIVLALAVMTMLQPGIRNIIIVIAIIIAPGTARIVRGTVLAIKGNVYIEAARSIGASDKRIIIRHILPNVFAPILILASIWVGNAIVIEATLSYLGLGTPPPTPSWGGMLALEGRRNLENAPWLAIAPGVAISVAVIAVNMLGDALRDVLDPRLRTR